MTGTKSLVILSDFDGTIVTLDLAAHALEVFVGEQWKDYDDLYVQGKITLKECIESQYTMFTNTKKEILEGIDDVIEFTPGFEDFIKFVKETKTPFEIVSAGLDFIISHSLAKINLSDIKFYSVEAFENNGSMKVKFIEDFQDPTSPDFKSDLVRQFKKQNRVIYIGDGSSDFGAVMDADFTFSVKNSVLSEYCKKNKIEFKEFSNFNEIKKYLETNAS